MCPYSVFKRSHVFILTVQTLTCVHTHCSNPHMSLWSVFKQSYESVVSVQTLTHPRAQVAFSAELSPAPASRMLLDDVSLRAGACTPTGSCDFESGQCTWLSHARAAPQGHHWVHADGHTQGPKFDHTTHTPDGEAPLLSHHFGAVFFSCVSP